MQQNPSLWQRWSAVLLLLLSVNLMAVAQKLEPVKWSFVSKKISDTEYELLSTAKIDKGWYVYSQFLPSADGPVATSFHFDKGAYSLVGKCEEVSDHRKDIQDPVFEMRVIKFSDEVTFKQRIKTTDPSKPVKGYLEYMTCDNERCLPPDEVNFNFALGGKPAEEVPAKVGAISVTDTAQTAGDATTATETGAVDTAAVAATTEVLPAAAGGEIAFDTTGMSGACGEGIVGETVQADTPLWQIFVWGFLGGLLAILMPCIFPMIPLTVSFFTKSSTTRAKGIRNALWYGASIIFIYVGLGMLINSIFGADALNALSTNVWFNIGLFVMLVAFAFSFFGYFELTLPSSWANKSDQLADKGGLLGIFFMAFTLAIVSFSCTGPLIGNLLVLNAKGGFAATFAGMFGFGLALALPFALFSAFPAWLHSLPRSGSWMDDLKVTLGFAELALGLKFLSVADMTMGWKILPYELFMGLWVLFGLGLTAYFLGWLKFPHTAPRKVTSPGNLLMVLLSLLFTVYSASGFRVNQASKTFITPAWFSGLPPPPGWSYIYPKHCPHDLNCYHDFDEALAVAKRENKPILIDFTGYGCVNCRKMEDNVWNKPGVYELIKDKYVLVSLYVDERLALPQTYEFEGRTRRTYGHKWTDFQIKHFNRNSQPYYVPVSPDLKVLTTPTGAEFDVEKYRAFLQCGVDRFNASK